MTAEHAVSIFVFRERPAGWEYLVVRRRPVCEFHWNPIRTALLPEDTIRRAALRRMRGAWRAPDPRPWIDLDLCEHMEVGGVDLVQWCVGYGVEGSWVPRQRERGIARWCWAPLSKAFQLLQGDELRRALFRLHLDLSGR